MTTTRKKTWQVGGGVASSVLGAVAIGYFKEEEMATLKFIITQLIVVLQNLLEYLN
jgi:hypothetical protein